MLRCEVPICCLKKHGLAEHLKRVLFVDAVLLCALHHGVGICIDVGRGRAGIRNGLVYHVLTLEHGRDAHRIEQAAHLCGFGNWNYPKKPSGMGWITSSG